ncbi:MAG: CPBP family intramembrane metalloprotease [Micropruina sp.]|uniref:CPBP family intramembrane glutamic endopeptidase n=1 Tax=Micropruina sp. TaxID=2737536 RepID=UPI0039E56B96
MVEFVLLCLPTVGYLAVQSRRPGQTLHAALGRAGLGWGTASGYGWAALLLLPLLLIGWLSLVAIPPDLLAAPGVVVGRPASLAAAAGVVLRAAGEEVFFRGLLGGVLVRRLGFGWGNLLQSVLFFLPHLALLAVDVRLWPILPVQFVTGWLLGWLRQRTATMLPGAVLHAVANLTAGLIGS